MRKVAVALALLSVLAVFPPAAAEDECRIEAATGRVCVAIPADRPSTPPGLPGAPPQTDPYYGTYYVWMNAQKCSQSAIGNACRGVPVGPGSGVPTPAGNVGAGVFSVVYEESNGVPGLQRQVFIFGGGVRPPDRTVLV